MDVPTCMVSGEKFVRWDEDSMNGTPVTLRVDLNGFYLTIADQNQELEVLDIRSIRDTRTGCYARTPKDQRLRETVTMGSVGSLEDKTVTVCYGNDFVNMNFINFCCNKPETAKLWCDQLLRMAYNMLSVHSSVTAVLQKTHARICLYVDKAGKIPVKVVIKTFATHKDDRKKVEKALDACGLPSSKNEMIDSDKFKFSHFMSFYMHLTGRKEIQRVFDGLCEDGDGKKKGHLSVSQLVEFLNLEQRDPRLNEILFPYTDAQKAREIIDQFEPNRTNVTKGQLSLEGFMQYLMSEENAVVPLSKLNLSQDMDQPLSHYFINSSHNTYLTGHQLTGKSSVEMYRQCLLSGCRCVELDLWNGRLDEPVIRHGYTLVPEIPAKDVISAIAESAFKTSDWPVILSFENHCNRKQQVKVARYCREIFGDMLLDQPLLNYPLVANQSLPPPSALMRKIIIKNKKISHDTHSVAKNSSAPTNIDSPTNRPAQSELFSAADVEEDSFSDDSFTDEESERLSASSVDDEDFGENSQIREPADKERGTAGKESQAAAELSALVNYVQPIHFHSFTHAEKRNRSYEMSSFVETQATNLLKTYPIEFVNYNRTQLSRVYPKGTRVDSHNFMPHVYWNAGCQLVSLNFQTLDLPMQLNIGIFEYNNRSGYLLKPVFMRRSDRKFDPFVESTLDGVIAGYVSVKVISGQFLSEKRVGVWVEAEMYGLPTDTVRRKYRTRVIQNNSINPVWDEPEFVFKKVVLPDLACVRLAAYEESGRMLGHRVLPVVGLRPGYRHISLRNESGLVQGHGTLFVKLKVRDYVPSGLTDFAEALVNPIKYQSELEKRAKQLSVLTDEPVESLTDGFGGAVCAGSSSSLLVQHSAVSRVDSASAVSDVSLSDQSPAASMAVSMATRLTIAEDTPAGSVHEETNTHTSPATSQPNPRRLELSSSIKSNDGPTFPEELTTAESFESLWKERSVQDKRAELDRKWAALIRQYEKAHARLMVEQTAPQASVSNHQQASRGNSEPTTETTPIRRRVISLPRRASNKRTQPKNAVVDQQTSAVQDVPGNVPAVIKSLFIEWAAAEKDLHRKYIEVVYDSLEKAMRSSQAYQLKKLSSYYDRIVAVNKKQMEANVKEANKKVAKIHTSKDEAARRRREISHSFVNEGVEQRKILAARYAEAIESLGQQHQQVREVCAERRATAVSQLADDEKIRLKQLLEKGPQATGRVIPIHPN